jgi:hypothetical protein
MAKKDVGEMRRAAGFQVTAWNHFTDAFIVTNGTADQLYDASDDELKRAMQAAAQVLVGNARMGSVIDTLELTVDHSKSVKAMLKAGKYDWKNSNITDANFPHQREGVETVTIDLVRFDQSGTTAERERQLVAHGDLAEMDDMLALGVQHPDQQCQYPIVFLGAVWAYPDGHRYVGYLDGDASGRGCHLHWDGPDDPWNPRCVFAVRRRK